MIGSSQSLLALLLILPLGFSADKPKIGTRLAQVDDNSSRLNRVEVFNGANLSRKNKNGKELDVTDEGWAAGRYYFDKEKTPFTGDVILTDSQGPKHMPKAILAFEDGRQEGQSILMYPGGKTKAQGTFRDSMLQEAKGWRENGEKKFEAKLKGGKLVSLQLWAESGEEEKQGNLPNRIPSYIRGLIAATALAAGELLRGVVPKDDIWNGRLPFGRRLDNWLQQHANQEQRARYHDIYNKLRNHFLNQNFNLAQANLKAYKLIRSPKVSAAYMRYFFGVKPGAAGDNLLRKREFKRIREVNEMLWGKPRAHVIRVCGRPDLENNLGNRSSIIYDNVNIKFTVDMKFIVRLILSYNKNAGIVTRIDYEDDQGRIWTLD